MNTQVNLDINSLTVYQALEDMEGHSEMMDDLAAMIIAVRDGDNQAVLRHAREIAETVVGEITGPEFIEHWPHDTSLLIAA